MARTRAASRRGATLIELLIAAVIMIIGLTGITSMMLGISTDTRAGVGRMNASSIASSTMQQTSGVGYCNLAVGTFDGGLTYDGAGRLYGTIVGVTSVGNVAEPTMRVDVQVQWSDAQRVPHLSNATTLVSRPPDAGC